MRKRSGTWLLLISVFAIVWGLPGWAHAFGFEVGVQVGGGRNLLTQPRDRAGQPTLLHGTAFTGLGLVVGPTASLTIGELGGARFSLSADLLYGYHQGAGFAEYPEGQRIDITLTTQVLRLPFLMVVGTRGKSFEPHLGLGIEPIVGFSSKAEVFNTGIDRPAESLKTTSMTAVTGVFALGFDLNRESLVFPFALRVSWNPFVGSTTRDRFDGYQSPENPGAYKVLFDWQIMAIGGLRWGF